MYLQTSQINENWRKGDNLSSMTGELAQELDVIDRHLPTNKPNLYNELLMRYKSSRYRVIHACKRQNLFYFEAEDHYFNTYLRNQFAKYFLKVLKYIFFF
jgi:hypothetical protein